MTRAPCRVLRGVGDRPITSVSGHGSAAEAGSVTSAGSPVTTSGRPVRHTLTKQRAPTAVAGAGGPATGPNPAGRPLTPGPVVDEQLPPAGPVSTVEGQSLRSRPHSMENPPCA